MLASWASLEGKYLVHCLLHWISGVQVTVLSIRDEHVFSLSATCLLEDRQVRHHSDQLQTCLGVVFLECQQRDAASKPDVVEGKQKEDN